MKTQLIRLDDETLVEIEARTNQMVEVSSSLADRVGTTLDKIQPILSRTGKPINAAWKELNQEMNIEQAEVELGLSFEGEGNLYITKSKATANLTIKLILKSKD